MLMHWASWVQCGSFDPVSVYTSVLPYPLSQVVSVVVQGFEGSLGHLPLCRLLQLSFFQERVL